MFSLVTHLLGKPLILNYEFPLCTVGGFTPLTSLVASEQDEIFSFYNIFFGARTEMFLQLYSGIT